MICAPHDLILLPNISAFHSDVEVPSWVKNSLNDTRTVVVRRGHQTWHHIPVGVRGFERSHRFGGYLDPKADNFSLKITTPYELAEHRPWEKLASGRAKLPALHALPQITKDFHGYHWGIAGSSGYELATGHETVKATSDLDILLKDCPKLSQKDAQDLLARINTHGVHADIQVVSGQNGFSLEEYANARTQTVLVKTVTGPKLSEDPFGEEN